MSASTLLCESCPRLGPGRRRISDYLENDDDPLTTGLFADGSLPGTCSGNGGFLTRI
jgi:hypothetical protein